MTQPPAAWSAVYPAMRQILDAVIRANRGASRPVANVSRLERARLELGQLDRGTHRPCTQSPPAFSPFAAFSLVREVCETTPLGHPATGAIYRLAAELADQSAVFERRFTPRSAAAYQDHDPAAEDVA
jgi:hypothetical protein